LFYIVTLGLIAFVVNALLFLLVDWIAGLLKLPFNVDGFWAAFWGAIIVGVVSWIINLVIPDRKPTISES
jgi:putative membrane protein